MASFTAYCDESYITASRYRGVAAVSLPANAEEALTAEVRALLADSQVTEFKWSKLTNAKYRFAAAKLLRWTVRAIASSQVRVDVLSWDTEDRRHRVRGRDDDANFERMFFHLLRVTLAKRAAGAEWCVYPDEKFGVHWATVNDCLQAVGSRARDTEPALFAEFVCNQSYVIRRFLPVRSDQQPFVQLADLFCGLAVFSRLRYDAFSAWVPTARGQMTLCTPIKELPPPSQVDAERFQVLQDFKETVNAAKLGVSLDSSRGLRTHQPSRPLNFWWYVPQHDNDRAPVKPAGTANPYRRT
jgi:hypothetical protein